MIKLSEILKDTNDAAGIAYSYKGYLLCVRDNKGLWGIPKGHIQKGETPEQGAMREFTEETQIMLNRPIKFSHTSPKKKGKFHIYYCMGDKRVNPHIGHEHTEEIYR
jgi:ADP-ribose pyrophosphatase YjhB (NUDIX family)